MARVSPPGPVQAIVGEDTYLAEEALERVLGAAIGADRAEALQVLYGDEKKWEDVLAAARTGSLFASRRAIVVRRADQLKYANAPADDEEALPKARKGKARVEGDPVEAYAENPSPDATLVLLAAKPDRRRHPWKKLLATATVHDAAPRKGRALRAHVEENLRARGLRFAPDALGELLAEMGGDLRRLMGEVDKLEAWAAGRKEITAEDLAAALGRGLGQPLYLLSDAFAGRDVGDEPHAPRAAARGRRGAAADRRDPAPFPAAGEGGPGHARGADAPRRDRGEAAATEHAVQARGAPRRHAPLERAGAAPRARGARSGGPPAEVGGGCRDDAGGRGRGVVRGAGRATSPRRGP